MSRPSSRLGKRSGTSSKQVKILNHSQGWGVIIMAGKPNMKFSQSVSNAGNGGADVLKIIPLDRKKLTMTR